MWPVLQGVQAVTWGVFPGREVLQPTVIDPDAFMVWKVRPARCGWGRARPLSLCAICVAWLIFRLCVCARVVAVPSVARVRQEECFALWLKHWGEIYEESTPSSDIIHEVYNTCVRAVPPCPSSAFAAPV
jgi:hypothetical protein